MNFSRIPLSFPSSFPILLFEHASRARQPRKLCCICLSNCLWHSQLWHGDVWRDVVCHVWGQRQRLWQLWHSTFAEAEVLLPGIRQRCHDNTYRASPGPRGEDLVGSDCDYSIFDFWFHSFAKVVLRNVLDKLDKNSWIQVLVRKIANEHKTKITKKSSTFFSRLMISHLFADLLLWNCFETCWVYNSSFLTRNCLPTCPWKMHRLTLTW